MANILNLLRKQPNLEQVSSITNSGLKNESQVIQLVEDLECVPWTTRKLKIPTSASGHLIIECFESAEGKRLMGLGKTEPEFFLPNLKIVVPNPFGFDDLRLFPISINDPIYTETDFMSQVIKYPERGRLSLVLSLLFGKTRVQCKLWF